MWGTHRDLPFLKVSKCVLKHFTSSKFHKMNLGDNTMLVHTKVPWIACVQDIQQFCIWQQWIQSKCLISVSKIVLSISCSYCMRWERASRHFDRKMCLKRLMQRWLSARRYKITQQNIAKMDIAFYVSLK